MIWFSWTFWSWLYTISRTFTSNRIRTVTFRAGDHEHISGSYILTNQSTSLKNWGSERSGPWMCAGLSAAAQVFETAVSSLWRVHFERCFCGRWHQLSSYERSPHALFLNADHLSSDSDSNGRWGCRPPFYQMSIGEGKRVGLTYSTQSFLLQKTVSKDIAPQDIDF